MHAYQPHGCYKGFVSSPAFPSPHGLPLFKASRISFKFSDLGPQSFVALLGLLERGAILPGTSEGAVHIDGVRSLFHPLQSGVPDFLEHTLSFLIDQPLFCCKHSLENAFRSNFCSWAVPMLFATIFFL